MPQTEMRFVAFSRPSSLGGKFQATVHRTHPPDSFPREFVLRIPSNARDFDLLAQLPDRAALPAVLQPLYYGIAEASFSSGWTALQDRITGTFGL